MAVVKADAYGHGVDRLAAKLVDEGIDYFGVALPEEGIHLRKNCIKTPILVFGGFFENQIDDFILYDLDFTVSDPGAAKAIAAACDRMGKEVRVHLKIDTGMGRVGVRCENAAGLVKEVVGMPRLKLAGIYSHFASSDARDKSYAELQLARFRRELDAITGFAQGEPLVHMANSGAILDIPGSWFDLVRPGVMLYGYYPSKETSECVGISPSVSIRSKVMAVNDLHAGEFVSYNSTWQTSRATRIAVIPIGYGDGFNRLLSNKAEVLIDGRRFPLVGTICMDLVMVDVGPGRRVQVGDEVVLLGRQGNEEITIYEWCEKLNTIPYEITCWLSSRLPRIYRD
jgi:alanine racemase